ncbi:hypothetical protein [Streptomyces benahoarensis]|uniref:Uncharacterized protein n=1 Tax=Streptomyces benahoarensis TaxID=2595054 RepID=A0A553Z9Q4_9ACTN|nr:hypothetical protein [Streptomyces benahoarensis]TSB19892.1 hypothetical protein FNJ62_21765 [Streptomyces benahoarensis]TSB38137.1 hypothetical protein FNZ23_17530 [Streptomyces benahoarensis]
MTGYYGELRADWTSEHTSSESWVLAVRRTESSLLAARWALHRAGILADQLDPESTLGHGGIQALRAWADDPTADRPAQRHVKAGHPLIVTVQDGRTTYTISVWPVRQPADEHPIGPPESITHRIGGLRAPLYVVAEDPWRQP